MICGRNLDADDVDKKTAAGRFREALELMRGEFIRQSQLRAADDLREFHWSAMDELPDAEQIAFEHERCVLGVLKNVILS